MPDRAALETEARSVAAEAAELRRSLRPGTPPDRAIVARLARCYDRLDDIAAVIGWALTQAICAAAQREALGENPT